MINKTILKDKHKVWLVLLFIPVLFYASLIGVYYWTWLPWLLLSLPLAILFMKQPFWGLLLFCALIPVDVVLTTGEGGATLTRLLGIFIAGLWIAQFLFSRRSLRFNILLLPFIFYVLWGILSVLWSDNSGSSMSMSVVMIQMLILSIMIIDQIDSRARLEYVLVALLVGGVAAIVLGNTIGSFNNVSRLVLVENIGVTPYGYPLAFSMIIFLMTFIFGRRGMRWLALVFFLLGSFPMIAVGLRGALLAMVVGCVIGVIFAGVKTRTIILIAFLVLILYQIVNIFIQQGALPSQLLQHLTSTSTEELIGFGRPLIWKVVWLTFLKHPFLGVGLNRFVGTSGQYTQFITHYLGAHNDYLAAAAELGIPGFLLLASGDLFIVVALIRARHFAVDKQSKYLHATILALLVGTMVGALFTQLILLKFFWVARALGIVAGQPAFWKKE